MRFLVVLFISFLTIQARAEWIATPVALPARFERGEDQIVKARSAFAVAVGHRFDELVLFAEVQQGRSASGTDFSGVDRQQTEFTVWRQSEAAFKNGGFLFWNLGFGLLSQELTTHFSGTSEKTTGVLQPLTGVGFGGGFEMKKTLRLSAEGRMYFSPEFDPNPQPEISVRLGFLFF